MTTTADKYYFTGKPCKFGHIAPRLKSNRNCQVCVRARRKEYETSETYTAWKKENKAKVAEKWRKKHRDQTNSFTASYRASRLQRTPKWLTDSQKRELLSFYKMAAQLETVFPWKQHVDHIIPLQGKTVSGLHVPWNLQIIPEVWNKSKGNRIYDES